MQKDAAFKQLETKGIERKEIDEKFEEAKKFMTEKGVKKELVESFAISRLMSHYKRILMSPSKTFEGIVYGIDRITDYGAQKQYDESVEMWEADKEKSIAEGYTDTEGNPLYHGSRKPKTGIRKIDLDKDRGKPIYLIAKSVEGDKDTVFRRAVMTLKPNKFSETIPLFQVVKFKAIKGTKSTDKLYILSQSELTDFEVVDTKVISFKDIATMYLKENICTNLTKLVDWHKEHEDDINRQVIIKGNVVDIRITGEGISNLVTLGADELGIDEKPITCWIPEDAPIDFDENAMEIIVVGRTNLKEEDEGESVFLNAVGIWCPEMFRVERTSDDEMDESKIEEKVVEKKPTPKAEPKVEPKPVVASSKKSAKKEEPPKKEPADDELFESDSDDDVGSWAQ